MCVFFPCVDAPRCHAETHHEQKLNMHDKSSLLLLSIVTLQCTAGTNSKCWASAQPSRIPSFYQQSVPCLYNCTPACKASHSSSGCRLLMQMLPGAWACVSSTLSSGRSSSSQTWPHSRWAAWGPGLRRKPRRRRAGWSHLCLLMYLLIHSTLHLYQLVWSYIYSCMHSFVQCFIHSFIHPSMHSFVRSFLHPSIHSFIHSFKTCLPLGSGTYSPG